MNFNKNALETNKYFIRCLRLTQNVELFYSNQNFTKIKRLNNWQLNHKINWKMLTTS